MKIVDKMRLCLLLASRFYKRPPGSVPDQRDFNDAWTNKMHCLGTMCVWGLVDPKNILKQQPNTQDLLQESAGLSKTTVSSTAI